VMERYSWDSVVAKYETLLSKLVSR
jgi:hypothetical protein